MRWPVRTKIALAMAGATGGTPGSPMPPGGASESRSSTCSARGASAIRTSQYVSKFYCSVMPAFIVAPRTSCWTNTA